ncbi:hypothetical protein RAC79_23860 [Agrobacterium sp. LR_9]|uniref:hypothetical protein n=1 Tax=Agrobacterium sp. LR_9 TaxID=3055787 RepID=UPI0035C1A1C0
MRAAMDEIAAHGLDGARTDTIARRAESKASSQFEMTSPAKGVEIIVRFVWHYFLDNPEILSLLDTENIHAASTCAPKSNTVSLWCSRSTRQCRVPTMTRDTRTTCIGMMAVSAEMQSPRESFP